MDDRTYKLLRNIAIAFTVLWLGWEAYGALFGAPPGNKDYVAGNTLFEDGAYDRALTSYREALTADPDNLYALRGIGRSLMQLGRDDEALTVFDQVIDRDPSVGATYANRGILLDRMGRYAQAIKDYETALKLDPKLAEGPNWLTRFMRNQPDKPPSIADRLAYLKLQLQLPEAERVLRQPEVDADQRPYKM